MTDRQHFIALHRTAAAHTARGFLLEARDDENLEHVRTICRETARRIVHSAQIEFPRARGGSK